MSHKRPFRAELGSSIARIERLQSSADRLGLTPDSPRAEQAQILCERLAKAIEREAMKRGRAANLHPAHHAIATWMAFLALLPASGMDKAGLLSFLRNRIIEIEAEDSRG